MFLQPYQLIELNFAYCYHVYLRWRTHRGNPFQLATTLDQPALNSLVSKYDIRVLECATDATDFLVQVSLKPSETISACASKLKGQVSKWLRQGLELNQPTDLLSKGYFGCTVGKSTREAVERYLNDQAEHHAYDKRVLPPVYVNNYALTDDDAIRISPRHAFVVAQFHLVLSTSFRHGVFGSQEGQRVAANWRKLQTDLRFALLKVSFVPDHVHVALRMHPELSPAEVVAALMNSARQVMERELVVARLDRLWQPSAYVGGYGDLASPQIRKDIENWGGSL